MPPKRTYLTCHKCSKNAMGRYKDEEGNPICYGCNTNKRNKTKPCKICGSGHFCTRSDDLCFTCWHKEYQKELRGCRKCDECGNTIKSKMPFMTKCIHCMGKKEYDRLLTIHKHT